MPLQRPETRRAWIMSEMGMLQQLSIGQPSPGARAALHDDVRLCYPCAVICMNPRKVPSEQLSRSMRVGSLSKSQEKGKV